MISTLTKRNREATDDNRPIGNGLRGIMLRSLVQIVRRPLMWVGMLILPLFMFLFVGDMLNKGLPTRIPAAIVDRDGSQLSRQITQTLGGMQMVHLTETPNSYTEARHSMQEGHIYGFFLIPENFQADLLAGRKPVITFYTNMVYYVPGSLLYKTFKSTAIYSKAGVAMQVVQDVGANPSELSSLMQPINIQSRGIGNPSLNYGIYLANSFIPGCLQLMIMLITVFSLGQEIKYHTSRRLMRMADGSIFKALVGKLLPQTLIWFVVVMFMMAWLFKFNHYPMYGSWFWLVVSELLFVLAAQGFALTVFGLLPNLRLSLSVCALLGVLNFSISAYSLPVPSMYGAIGIFSYLMPARYNFLIYANVALNGLPVYYSRIWFAAYFVYLVLPFTVLGRIRRYMLKPVYCP